MTSALVTDEHDAQPQAAKEPATSLSLLKAMVDSSPDAIAVKDKDLVYLACNSAFLLFLGKSEKEVIGKTDADLISRQEAELCRLSDRQVLDTGETVLSEECSNISQRERCFHVTKSPFRSGEGAIDGIVIVARDITERRLAEESVRLQAERYDTLLTTSQDGFWISDTNGRLREVNQALCSMSGYSREELLGMHIPDLEALETPEETARHIQTIINNGFDRFETRHRRKDGTIIDVEISTSFLAHTGEFLVFCRDITEQARAKEQRKRYEAELRKARKRAEQQNESKTRFLATASHDLRQPMQAMNLLAHLLVTSDLPADTAEIALRMQEAVDGLGDMLSALLDISKLDAGLVKTDLSDFRLNELLRKLTDEHLPLAVERGIALRYVDSRVRVHSDINLLTRILRNLISNAIKYTPSGTVLIGVRRAGSCVRIQVLDTGIGIGENELGRVFDEFHQLGNSARDRREGLGLGLAIVKRLAGLLNHSVELDSELGRGTCFSIVVPLALENEEKTQRLSDSQLLLPIPYEGSEILVVDDEVDIRQGLEMSLCQWGYSVSVAGDFDQAMAALKEDSPPVLVIADYRLGSKTGIEVIRAVRRQARRKVAALLLTGDATEERAREAAKLGVQLLHKPVSAEQLHHAVVDCLRATK